MQNLPNIGQAGVVPAHWRAAGSRSLPRGSPARPRPACAAARCAGSVDRFRARRRLTTSGRPSVRRLRCWPRSSRYRYLPGPGPGRLSGVAADLAAAVPAQAVTCLLLSRPIGTGVHHGAATALADRSAVSAKPGAHRGDSARKLFKTEGRTRRKFFCRCFYLDCELLFVIGSRSRGQLSL